LVWCSWTCFRIFSWVRFCRDDWVWLNSWGRLHPTSHRGADTEWHLYSINVVETQGVKAGALKAVSHFARNVPVSMRCLKMGFQPVDSPIKIKSSSQVNFLAYYGSISQSTFTKFWNLKFVLIRVGTLRLKWKNWSNMANA
jgi:hypothetical protein